jgi:tRNA modification GTPase
MGEPETIVAPATPEGKSALAILRISGKNAFKITAQCIIEKNLFKTTPARYINIYSVKHPESGNIVDQITAIKYFAPRSYTGEDMVELICHGGPIIVKGIFNALIKAGARSAEGGEFTRRALLNGKINLMRAEAILALIESGSETELQCAQQLYRGKSQELVKWRNKIIKQLERIETQIEFDETDSMINHAREGKKTIEKFLLLLKKDIGKREKVKVIEKGIKVVIAGPANAGKSTLFNTLVGEKRTIVHREPGTTRDVIGERLFFHGHDIQLFDTAGIRKTEQEIEREGIGRSRKAIKGAGIIIWVTAADEKLKTAELKEIISISKKTKTLCCINKIDIGDGKEKISAIKKKGISTISISLLKERQEEKMVKLNSKILKTIENIKRETAMPEMVFNTRQEEIGRSLIREVSMARDEWERPEIAAEYLKNGLSYMDEYFGKVHSEEVINGVFKDFCIGK